MLRILGLKIEKLDHVGVMLTKLPVLDSGEEIFGYVRNDLLLNEDLGPPSIIGMENRGVCCLLNRPVGELVGR